MHAMHAMHAMHVMHVMQDLIGEARVRGLGWALAPPGSDPQAVHADLRCRMLRMAGLLRH